VVCVLGGSYRMRCDNRRTTTGLPGLRDDKRPLDVLLPEFTRRKGAKIIHATRFDFGMSVVLISYRHKEFAQLDGDTISACLIP